MPVRTIVTCFPLAESDAQRIREVVAAGDEDGFVELMRKGKEYLALRGE